MHANLINLIVIVAQSYEPMTLSDFRTSSSAEVQSFLKVNFGSAHRNLKVAHDQVISGGENKLNKVRRENFLVHS